MKIFLDSSVLIAAMLSPEGGSAKILMLCEADFFDGYISKEIINEVGQVLDRKLPEIKNIFQNLIKKTGLHIIKKLSRTELLKAKNWISDPKDVKVLAGAKKAKVDYLITLDIHDFILDKKVAIKSGLKILTPADFLQKIILY